MANTKKSAKGKTKESNKERQQVAKMQEMDAVSVLKKGGVIVRTIIEIQGGPKEHIKETMKLLITKLSQDFQIIKNYENPTEEIEDKKGVFSTFTEFEILFESNKQFLDFCFDYTPSSVEVLEPEKFYLDTNTYSDFMNDVIAKLQENSDFVRKLTMENKILKYNSSAFLRNLIIIGLSTGRKTLLELSKIIGLKEQELEPVLKHLVEKKELEFSQKKYGLVVKK